MILRGQPARRTLCRFQRYPQRVCDYFQADFAPGEELAADLRRHDRDEAKHVQLFGHGLRLLGQPLVALPLGDMFEPP